MNTKNKINNHSKQISILTKTKLMNTEQKTNVDNTQMNASQNNSNAMNK